MIELLEKVRIWLVAVFASVALGVLPLDTVEAQQERTRKSIDNLTADELETYIHALEKIKEKSASDPTVDWSYAHMAGLHNLPTLFGGACEHWNHRFFAWHRALLLNYEDALRASDSPRTDSVTIPYWDWSIAPTGQRYPVAFENDVNAVEAHYGRPIDTRLLALLFRSNRNDEPSGPIYPWSALEPVARATGTAAFLGTAFDHGALENPPHDVMHGFIGGDLVLTSTAANDPIFWSFHTFIDLVWWWRQSKVSDTIEFGACSLNGMRVETALGSTGGPTKVSDVSDSVAQLGVTYDFQRSTPPPGPERVSAQRLGERLPWIAAKAQEEPDVLHRFEIDNLATEKTFEVTLTDAVIPTSIAYIALVFVHPRDVPFAQGDAAFRDRYLVAHFGQWANSHQGHMKNAPVTREFRFDVDRSVNPDISRGAASQLAVSVAIYVTATGNPVTPTGEAARVRAADSESADVLRAETAIGSAAAAAK